MDKKGDTPLTIMFIIGVFIFVWVIFLAKFINVSMNIAVNTGELTGIEAFFFSNFNLLIGGIVLLFTLGYMYFVQQ